MIADELKVEALRLGFEACGITTPEPLPHSAELDGWLANGMAGTMRYLHRQARRRKDPRLTEPEAKSIVVVLATYQSEPPVPARPSPSLPVRVARYARSQDYHEVVGERLERLAQWLRAHGAAVARPFVDAGPVPERELAQRAGLGWIGKNTMLIRPGVGSWTFIGSVFTDLELLPDQPFGADRCGSCTRCLDACPTAAFPAARVLDATRCISYLTIEQKGPIPESLVPALAGWAFGCDICNEVCPWNLKFSGTAAIEGLSPTPETDLSAVPKDHFGRLSDEEFDTRYRHTPFARPGRLGMHRNLQASHRSLGPPPGTV
ncbi:MAG: tRNA epoxyqueuosine(34) reductase QueG [Gemmatimonadales bacterium]